MRYKPLQIRINKGWSSFRTALGFFLVAVILAGCGKPPSVAQMTPQVSFVHPAQQDVTEWDEFTGRLDPIKSVDVRPRVNGYLDSIHFTDGQLVTAGQLLFIIDPRPYEAAAAKSHAEVARARAALELAGNDFNRAQRLSKGQVIADEEFDNWRNKLELTKAELARAEAEARAANLDLEFCQVKAPIAGRISKRFVDEGNLVQGEATGATLLTTIVPSDPLYVTFDMDEGTVLQYSPLRPDAPRAVRIALQKDSGFKWNGILSFIDNRLDENAGTLRGRAVISNPDGALTPGLFVRVQIRGRSPYPALLLSDEAIGNDQSRQFVMVVDDKEVVQRRFVSTGRLQDGQREITEGVVASDRVIVGGQLRVHPGDKVVAIQATAPAASVEVATAQQP